jgi:hypothetical protein
MNAATPTNEPPLIHPRLWAKAHAVIAVVFSGFFTPALWLGARAAPNEPKADLIPAVTLAVLWALALWAVLGLRAHTKFSEAGVVDVGVLRAVSLPWGLVTNCTVAEKTLRATRGPSIHGVLIRFTSQRTDPGNSTTLRRPRDRVIELFVPDAVPLAPAIISLLRTIPEVSQAPWDLLEPSLRRQASASGRKQA